MKLWIAKFDDETEDWRNIRISTTKPQSEKVLIKHHQTKEEKICDWVLYVYQNAVYNDMTGFWEHDDYSNYEIEES